MTARWARVGGLFICDLCGCRGEYRRSVKQWNGLRVHSYCFEPRQPQDFPPPGPLDDPRPLPDPRPESGFDAPDTPWTPPSLP